MTSLIDFFEQQESSFNLLEDGIDITYDKDFLSPSYADKMFHTLKDTISYERPSIHMYGITRKTPRGISWHADSGLIYTYSGISHTPKEWDSALSELRLQLREKIGFDFNGVLLNRYENEKDSVSFHSDDEPSLVEGAPIASLSFGGERDFVIKHVFTGRHYTIPLKHGSLLLMRGDTQKVSVHGIPKRSYACSLRINLTFRCMKKD